jgi:hypothetical protein
MAKVKYTAIVAEMRNSIAGSTFSKNRYGNYVRTKVSPVNPQTTYQQNQRAMLSSLSASWRGLTQAQRDAWSAYAQNVPRTDIFGDSKILSGQAIYVACNLNLVKAGIAVITSPGTSNGSPILALDTLVVNNTGSAMAVTFNINTATVPTNFSLVVYATPAVPPGRGFVKNLFRYVGVFTATANAVTAGTAYTARFGIFPADNFVYLRAALLDNETGLLGVPVEISAVSTD